MKSPFVLATILAAVVFAGSAVAVEETTPAVDADGQPTSVVTPATTPESTQ